MKLHIVTDEIYRLARTYSPLEGVEAIKQVLQPRSISDTWILIYMALASFIAKLIEAYVIVIDYYLLHKDIVPPTHSLYGWVVHFVYIR